MKKVVTWGLLLAMLVSTLALAASAAVTFGDIYTDGSVDTKDAVKLAQVLAGWKTVSLSEGEKVAADVYRDGNVDTKDAVKLAQYLAGWNVVLGDGNTRPNAGDETGDNEIHAGGLF